MMKRIISVFLALFICAMLPVSVLASEGSQSASKSGPVAFEGEGYIEVTAPVLYDEAPVEEEPQTFEGEPVEAPVLYEDAQTGMDTCAVVAIIAAAAVVVAAVVFFLLRKKK